MATCQYCEFPLISQCVSTLVPNTSSCVSLCLSVCLLQLDDCAWIEMEFLCVRLSDKKIRLQTKSWAHCQRQVAFFGEKDEGS